MVVAKVAAVAPVRSVASDVQSNIPTPSVINLVQPTGKPGSNDPVYSNVADPMRRVLDPPAEPQDWTLQKPALDKVEKPAAEPLSKVLMEHIKSMWTASADAVKVDPAKKPVETESVEPASKMKVLAADALTYSPGKITKPEKS